MEPIAIITEEFQTAIAAITRRHIGVVWAILSDHVTKEFAISRINLVQKVRKMIGKPKYDERSVRKIIEVVRDVPIPVCSDKDGYWIGTPEETLAWAKWYMRHAFTMLKKAWRLVKLAERMSLDPELRAEANKTQVEIQLVLNLEEKGI